MLAPIQALLDDLMAKDPAIKAKVSFAVGEEKCYTGNKIQGERFFPGWLFDENDAFVQDILTEPPRHRPDAGGDSVQLLHQWQPLCR